MLETNMDANYGSNVQSYASALITRIKTGAYKSLASSWISCSSTTTPLSKRLPTLRDEIAAAIASRSNLAVAAITPLKCPLVWAQEANAYDCVRYAAPFSLITKC
jgi:hypothetical protein